MPNKTKFQLSNISKGFKRTRLMTSIDLKWKNEISDYSLLELRSLCSKHPAFVDSTHLEIIAKKYNINIHFIPKFHCELNPIEGRWSPKLTLT